MCIRLCRDDNNAETVDRLYLQITIIILICEQQSTADDDINKCITHHTQAVAHCTEDDGYYDIQRPGRVTLSMKRN